MLLCSWSIFVGKASHGGTFAWSLLFDGIGSRFLVSTPTPPPFSFVSDPAILPALVLGRFLLGGHGYVLPPPFRGIRHDCVPPFRGKDVGPDWVGSSISLRIPPFRKGRMDPFSLGSTPWTVGWIRIPCAKPGGRVHPTPTHEHVHGRLEQVSKGRAGR